MTFGDINWFILWVWIVLNVIARLGKDGSNSSLQATGSIMGMILAIYLLEENHIYAFLFLLINIVMLFECVSKH